jgi:hypothetical protein
MHNIGIIWFLHANNYLVLAVPVRGSVKKYENRSLVSHDFSRQKISIGFENF